MCIIIKLRCFCEGCYITKKLLSIFTASALLLGATNPIALAGNDLNSEQREKSNKIIGASVGIGASALIIGGLIFYLTHHCSSPSDDTIDSNITDYVPLSDEEISATQEQAIKFLREEQRQSEHDLLYKHPKVQHSYTTGSYSMPKNVEKSAVYKYPIGYNLNTWCTDAPIYIETSTANTVTCILPASGFGRMKPDMSSSIRQRGASLKTKYKIQLDASSYDRTSDDTFARCKYEDIYNQLQQIPNSNDGDALGTDDKDITEFTNEYLLYETLDNLYDPAVVGEGFDHSFIITEERDPTNGKSRFHVQLMANDELYGWNTPDPLARSSDTSEEG